MDRDGLFELRVLTGLHSGARALLTADAQTLGSSPDCDLVITDDGVLAEHARIAHQESGNAVLEWLDGGSPAVVIRPGQGVSIGPVLVSVDTVDSPWRMEVPLSQETAKPDEPAPGDLVADADGLPAHLAARSAAAGWRQRLTRPPALAGALLLLLFASALGGWTVVQRRDAAQAAAASATPPAPAPAPALSPAAYARLQGAVAGLELGSRVRIVPGQAGGQPWVEASLLSDEEAESLAYALSRLTPRPRLTLLTAEDIATRAEAVAAARVPGRKLTFRHAGKARFDVSGRVRDAAARDELLAALSEALPQVEGFQGTLVTDDEAAEALLKILRSGGVSDVRGTWQDDVLLLDARMAQAELPNWERLLLDAAQRSDLRFRATVQLLATPAQPPVRLPFSVRSVVSADLPYVVLSDGRKLVAGATLDGWRLGEIRTSSVVFESADGRRLTLER